ncbi:Ankyrin [Balamuthia mandrillaris]
MSRDALSSLSTREIEQLFKGNVFSALAERTETSSWLGDSDLVTKLSAIRANGALYASYKTMDQRVEAVARILAEKQAQGRDFTNTRVAAAIPPQSYPSWSSYYSSAYSSSNTSSSSSSSSSSTSSASTSPYRSTATTTTTTTATAATTTSSPDLFNAVRNGNLSRVKAVVSRQGLRACLTQRDEFGYSALHLASTNGHTEVVRYLLQKRMDVNLKSTAAGQTPLHLATLSRHTEIAKLLLRHGADAQITDNDGNNALEYALRNAEPELITVLLEALTGEHPIAGAAAELEDDADSEEDPFAAFMLPSSSSSSSSLSSSSRPSLSSSSTAASRSPVVTRRPIFFGSVDEEDEDVSVASLFGDDEEEVQKKDNNNKSNTKPGNEQSCDDDYDESLNLNPFSIFMTEDDEDESESKEQTTAMKKPFDEEEDDFEDWDNFDLFSLEPVKAKQSQQLKESKTKTTTILQTTTTTISTTSTSTPSLLVQKGEVEAGGNLVSALQQRIQSLEAALLEKERHIQMRDSKISYLEEDSFCRICMDERIDTVHLPSQSSFCSPCSVSILTTLFCCFSFFDEYPKRFYYGAVTTCCVKNVPMP